jgi:hypothetical protein
MRDLSRHRNQDFRNLENLIPGLEGPINPVQVVGLVVVAWVVVQMLVLVLAAPMSSHEGVNKSSLLSYHLGFVISPYCSSGCV